MQAFRTALLAVACAALLAGCGGSGGKAGPSGFSSSDRKAAQTALRTLADTSVQTAAFRYTYEIGVANACRVHIRARKPLTFELFIAWKPGPTTDPNHRNWAWLRAVIGPEGLKRDYSFHLGTEYTEQALKTHYGDAFAKPSERCVVTEKGFSLLTV
jgi:hypothetical protein